MAGAPGFEPGHARIKTWCLTAWLYPKKILRILRLYNMCSMCVREARFELAYLTVPESKSGAST